MSPTPPPRIAKMGASGRRPLATTIRSPDQIGVGAVIFELPPKRHNSLPDIGSYPRMKLEPLVTSSVRDLPGKIVGVPQDGNSSRSVFQTVLPDFRSNAMRNDLFCWSHCTITRSRYRIGELAVPHS